MGPHLETRRKKGGAATSFDRMCQRGRCSVAAWSPAKDSPSISSYGKRKHATTSRWRATTTTEANAITYGIPTIVEPY
jgi:hypothetical protein